MKKLVRDYGNSAIGRAFGYSDVAVRKLLMEAGIGRPTDGPTWPTHDVPPDRIQLAIANVDRAYLDPCFSTGLRPTVEHVSRIISQIGEKARIVVVEPCKKKGKRIKFASAHDLRRGCASRLFDMGVSTETLRIILRHEDFKTTERHYGARRSAQAAALEIEQKLAQSTQPPNQADLNQLTQEQLAKLKALLNSI